MKEKLIRVMQGRYGVDQFSKFLLVLGLIAVVVSSVFVDNIAGLVFYILGWALVIYCYFRVFSRNIQKRYAENQAFLAKTYGIRNCFSGSRKISGSSAGFTIFIHVRHANRRSASRKGRERLRCAARSAALRLSKRADAGNQPVTRLCREK